VQFIAQPFGEIRLGEFLLSRLADTQWSVFRAAVAFVKRSGTQYIREPLRGFSSRARVKLSVGVDLFGTSREGLSDLLQATTPNGEVFIYRNRGPYTFHPKVYLFKSPQRADIIAGSGNLTGGGLFTNYEASIAVSLDLTLPADASFLQAVESSLDMWSQPAQGVCYALTPEFLDRLVASGLVRDEAQLAVMKKAAEAQQPPAQASNQGQGAVSGMAEPLFATVAVPPPPPIPSTSGLPASQIVQQEPDDEEAEGRIADIVDDGLSAPTFVISVLSVDLPVQGSSNEVTITKYIRNAHPEFWGWTSLFRGPDAATGQFRRDIRVRYGERLINAYLLDFPGRKPDGTKASADFRLGSIAPIVADLRQEDDLILLSHSGEPNVDYLARVVRVGDAEHDELMNGLQVYSRSRSARGTYRKFRYIS
jgi:HKD family nuclease